MTGAEAPAQRKEQTVNRLTRALIPLAGAALALTLSTAPAAMAGTPAGTPCSTAGPNPAPTVPGAPNSGTNTKNAGACDVQGSATISEVLAFESNATSFSFPNGITTTQTPQFAVYVYSNSPSGYYVTSQLTTPFAGTAKPSDILKASDFTQGQTSAAPSCNGVPVDGDTAVSDDPAIDGMSMPIQVAASPCASHNRDYQNNNSLCTAPPTQPCALLPTGMPYGTDRFSILGFSFPVAQLLDSSTAPADTYTGDFTYAAWA